MKTSLFNLHEINVNGESVLIEFYAGDIFDVYSDILFLSAFKGMFFPRHGTTWGCLQDKTGINVMALSEGTKRISDHIVSFTTPKNNCFSQLIALELCDLNNPNRFTKATLMTRFRELGTFLENYSSEEVESISLPLLGTGKQGLSLEESVSELLNSFNRLKKTNLKIIRVFARDFESVGVLNKKINELLNRTVVVHTSLLKGAIKEAKDFLNKELSPLSLNAITNLISLADSDYSSLDTFGTHGRLLAESVCNTLIKMYGIKLEPSTLHTQISQLYPILKDENRLYVISYLRLLQTYGNQSSHANNGLNLDQQDAAAIVISMIKIVDFYEYKLGCSKNPVKLNGADIECG